MFNVTRELHKSKAVSGKARLVRLLLAAAQRVRVRGARASQVGRVQSAVLVEHLSEAQLDSRTTLALNFQARPPHHVLSDVINEGAWRKLFYRQRLELFGLLNVIRNVADEEVS